MSKKILYMSSAKLTAFSIGLLLAVFCTIGMSFTPVEEEEIIIEQNDSTGTTTQRVIRKSHWDVSDGCGGTTQNDNKDYAKTSAITKGNGTVTIKNTTTNGSLTSTTTKTSTSTANSSADITWNCNESTDGHTNEFELTATPSNDYYFVGWSTSSTTNDMASTDNPTTITVTIPNGERGTSRDEQYESESSPYTTTYYAYFSPITYVDITFAAAPSGCQYKITVNGNSQTISTSNVTKTHIASATLSDPQCSGYVFVGWYMMDASGNVFDLSKESSYTTYFDRNVTIGARFVPTTTPKFKNITTGTEYYGLKAATVAATNGQTIIPVADCTVDGSDLVNSADLYTIPSGVTLLIPYSSDNSVQTTPNVVTTEAAVSIYRKLTIASGVNIIVNGTLCVGGQAMAGGGGNPTGYVTGACGMMDMSAGGHIEINNGGILYCWGFIKGQDMDQGNNTVGVGTITANGGATIWEAFATGDWRGGNTTSSIVGTPFFPFQSYFIQNIEVPVTYKYDVNGSSYNKNYFTLNATGGPYHATFTLIGDENSLFKISGTASRVRKWYDPTTDLMCYELSGTAVMDALKIVITGLPVVGNLDVNSEQFNLPINSNMHIILTNCTMDLTKPMTVQPGAKIEIKSDATVTLKGTSSKKANIYLFDKDDWGPWINSRYFRNYGNTYGNLTSHKYRGDGTSNELLDDAQFIVDGKLIIGSNAGLYTSAGGADIMGNGGGFTNFQNTLITTTENLVWYKGTKTAGDGQTGTVAMNQANLHNEDDSYTKAEKSIFGNYYGRWFNANSTTSYNLPSENADHTYNFTYIASGAVSGTGGTNVTPNTNNALYGEDKTGLVAGMKWCNVAQDATCSAIYNATQDLNGTPAADIRYTYQSSDWLQLLKTETTGVYGGSDNSLYNIDGCTITSLGTVDENCLYTIAGVKKALVDGHFVALAKNNDDEAWHNTANTDDYYICFSGCTWHQATKYEDAEKAYIVDGDNYIWYNGDWKVVERDEPYFFDYNAQNVAVYYEYENNAWVIAQPRVRVTAGSEVRNLYFLPPAFDIVKTKKTATITILKDITDTTTPLSYKPSNSTCTLDLNGHTISLTVTASGNSANLFAINAAGSTFTITDNSTNKDGILDITTSLKITSASNACRGIAVVNGALILNAGTVKLSNTYAYTSTGNSGMIKGIYVAAGKTFTMNGGAVESEAPYYSNAIHVDGSASANATVNINAGTITANTTTSTTARGIYTVGGTVYVKDGVTINATTTTTTACGIYVDASTSGYFGTLNMTGGTINATGGSGTAYGVYVHGVYVSNNTTPNTFGANYKAEATIEGGTFNVKTTTKTTAYGVLSLGTTTISGGTFTVAPKTTTAIGVYVQDGTTTIEGNPSFNVSATETAYGIQAGATPVEKTGRPYNGNVIVKGGTFDVKTTSKTTAYGVYVFAATRNTTSTDSGYYPGHYVSAGKATIEGGEFTVTSKTTTAYGVYVTRATPLYDAETDEIDAYAQGEATIKGGKFTVVGTTTASKTPTTDGIRAYGNVTITGGEFDVTASGGYGAGLRIFDGKTTVSGNPKFTVNATTYAYGAVVTGVAPTAKGFLSNAELEINNGTFDVSTTSTTYAYGALVSPVAPVATDDPEVFYKSPSSLTINDGTFTVKAQTTTAQGVNCSRGTLMAGTTPNVLKAENLGTANIYGGTFNVSTLGSTTAQGITNSGNTTVSNATFNVTPKSTTAYGARCYHGLLTINEGAEFNVTATEKAYGIVAGNEQPTTAGLLYDAEAVINGGTINVKTTTKATIYGLWASRNSRTIATGTANEGNYASAGKITINGGEIKVTAKTNPAYAVMVDAAVTQSGNADYAAATATPQTFINGGKFYVTATSSKNYAVSATPLAENFQITGGYYNSHTTETSGTYIDKYIVSPNKKLTLAESHELYPDYRYEVAEAYIVTFNMQGHGDEIDSQTIKKGQKVTMPTAPTEEGYTFGGWYKEADCTNVWNFASDAITEDVQLYAKWTINTRQLTWDFDGGATSSATHTAGGGVIYGTEIVYPANNTMTKADYVFSGWTTDITTMPDADLTITAQWTPAVASVTVNDATTYYLTIAEAWAFVNEQTADATLKLLKDVTSDASLVFTPAAAITCTLDLNNHTLSGAVSKLIDVNLAGSTFTVDDSSTEKEGKISMIGSENARIYSLYITAGTVNLEHGIIYSKNTNTGSSAAASAIYVTAGQKFTMDDGTVESESRASSYALYIAKSTVSVVTINGGLIKGHTNYGATAGGIYNYSTKLTINGGHIIGHAYTKTAYGVLNKYGKVTINGGIIEATNDTIKSKGSTTAYGIYAQYSTSTYSGAITIPATSTVEVLAKARTTTAIAVVIGAGSTGSTIAGGTFTAIAKTSTTARGISSGGNVTVSGGTFNVYAASTTSTLTTVPCGIYAVRGTVTVNGNPTFNVTSGGERAFGAFAYGTIGDTGVNSGKYPGTIKINGGTFNVTSTKETAYGVYAGLLTKTVAEAEGNVAGTHYMPGVIAVTDGTFNVKATTTTAYGIVVDAAKTETIGDVSTARRPTATITGGNFNVESDGDANATAYAMNTLATATYLKVQGGKYNTEKTNASSNPTIGGKYTAPTKSCDYHVLPLTGEDPYKFKVAEAYTVTFNTNGHGTAPDAQLIEKGQTVVEPESPTENGYIFDGWYKEEACTNQWDFSTDVVTAATVLYAKWTAAEIGTELDIIEWNGTQSVVINMNGEKQTTSDCASYPDGWRITVNDITKEYNNLDMDADRRITIDLSSLNLKAGDEVVIELIDGCGQTKSLHTYQVPYIYSTDGDGEAELSTVNENSKVQITKGALNVKNANVQLSSIVINPGSKLIVPSGVTLTIGTELIVRTTDVLAGEIENNGTIQFTEGAKMYYTRIATDREYHQFALPFDVEDLTKVVCSRYTDVNRTRKSVYLGATFSLSRYDGERRADNNTSTGNWIDLDRTYTTLKAGTGYLMLSGSQYYYEYYFPVTYSKVEDGAKVAVSKYEGTEKTAEYNKNWNYIASPYTHTFNYSFSDPADAIKLCYLQPEGYYIQDVYDKIAPARPFFYQPANDGYLTFSSSSLANISARNHDTSVQTQWLRLLYGKEGDALSSYDPTSIYLHPTRFLTEYEREYESMKQTTSGTKPVIYSSLPYGDLAFASVPDAVAESQMIPLTVYQPQAGEMRFTLSDNDFLGRLSGVLLYDSFTGRVIDLLVRDYVYEAEAGTIKDRFFLQPRFLSSMPQVTTDIGAEQDMLIVYSAEHIINVAGATEGETVYCFDATGRLVGKQLSTGLPLQFDVTADGMYIIKTKDKQVKVVVK